MNLKTILVATTLIAGATLATAPAYAGAQGGACPSDVGLGPFGGGGIGNASDCNLTITFHADGSITTSAGPGHQSTYDSIEDSLIGVVNNSGHTITSFNLSGAGIYGFDGDGIDGYLGIGPAGTNPDTTGYGGPNAFFTNIDGTFSFGTVNFANGGIPNGGTDYFSLEEPANLNLVVTNAPEPASMAILGVGLLGMGLAARRRRS